jgi:diadenosine tetraphosphate (Ap4A) HIT family hydrolase
MKYFNDHALDIKKYKYWTLALHANQYNLGRCVCYLNTYKEKLSDLLEEEYFELLTIIKNYEQALNILWSPDWWNYSQQGNITPHLHMHFVPRYKALREFDGINFADELWGKNYYNAPKKLLESKILQGITEAIKSNI